MASANDGIRAITAAMNLKPGEQDTYLFPTKNGAASFRVCCYRARTALKADADINVAISGNTVILQKGGAYMSAIRKHADGTVSLIANEVSTEQESSMKEKIVEIINDSMAFEDPAIRASFVKDAIAALRD